MERDGQGSTQGVKFTPVLADAYLQSESTLKEMQAKSTLTTLEGHSKTDLYCQWGSGMGMACKTHHSRNNCDIFSSSFQIEVVQSLMVAEGSVWEKLYSMDPQTRL